MGDEQNRRHVRAAAEGDLEALERAIHEAVRAALADFVEKLEKRVAALETIVGAGRPGLGDPVTDLERRLTTVEKALAQDVLGRGPVAAPSGLPWLQPSLPGIVPLTPTAPSPLPLPWQPQPTGTRIIIGDSTLVDPSLRIDDSTRVVTPDVSRTADPWVVWSTTSSAQ